MSLKSIIVLLIFLALGVFLWMNKSKVMSYFKCGMGQEQMQPPMQEDILVEEDVMPDKG